jgi:acyl dehydratase
MTTRYFEDFAAGDRWEFGDWALEEREMVAFATEHDPQPIHIDLAYGAASPYGSIIASGWLTMLKCIRPYIDGVMKDTAALGSPGLDELRWLKPVKPGDRVTACAEVLSAEASDSRPDQGKVTFRIFGVDDQGRDVVTTQGLFFIRRRPPANS